MPRPRVAPTFPLPSSHFPIPYSLDTDPLRYLRAVLGFFLGGGAVVALVLALTGIAPRALLLASLLWVLFGMLSGMVDLLLAPLAELAGGVLASSGRGSGLLAPGEDIRLGLTLATLYEQRLGDPGRALGEFRRLIDQHPHLRETVPLRARLAALQARHPKGGAR